MSEEDKPEKFYVTLERDQDGTIKGFMVSIDPPNAEDTPVDEAPPTKEEPDSTDQDTDFKHVIRAFQSAMDGYQGFIPLTLSVAPHMAYQIGFRDIHNLADAKGSKVTKYCTRDTDVFEIDIEHYKECMILNDRLDASVRGAKHLPEVVLVGLVSVYDAMLSRLLKVIFSKHEEIICTSEKTIKFSDLSLYESIDAARSALIEKEIESVLRESHHEQFSWMEKKFRMPLRKNLPIWPTFVEVCERRNLLTHTGGIVSAQYIASGKENNFDLSTISLGQRLKVDPNYYSAAMRAVYEVGAKLCHTLWRKFCESERKEADNELNELGVSLIRDRNYKLAEALLEFGAKQVRHHSDKLKRMMIVNWANAVRLQKRQEDAEAILQREDWSAVGDEFKICVAAVRQDEDEVVRLMHSLGANNPMNAEAYRTWPVFSGLRTKEKFAAAFEDLFGSKLLAPKKGAVESVKELPADDADTPLLGKVEGPTTLN